MVSTELDNGVETILNDARAELRAASRRTSSRSSGSTSPGRPRASPAGPGPGHEPDTPQPTGAWVNPDPASMDILTAAFTTTGRTIFNDLLGLAPTFDTPQGRVLAQAWAPVLARVSTNPTTAAVTATATVCLPYLAQLAMRNGNGKPRHDQLPEFAQPDKSEAES